MTYDDPSGHWVHIAVGAFVGATINTAMTAVTDYMDDGELNKNWKEYAASAAEGAIAGGVGAATGGASLGVTIAAEAAAGVVGNVARQAITKSTTDLTEINWTEAVLAGTIDAVSGVAGHYAGQAVKKSGIGKAIIRYTDEVKVIDKTLNIDEAIFGDLDSIKGTSKVGLNNSFPENGRYSSVMPKEYADALKNGNGKLSGGTEAWITASDDLAGINTVEGVANRLTLIDDAGNLRLHGDAVVQFSIDDMTGIASPYNRTNAGFINGGRTGGGAREWLVQSDIPIYDVNVRYLGR